MRITNPTISNNMMLNINKNIKVVNKLYDQTATGKKISVPSEDPILAARALKFRTSLKETEQYKKNTQQAVSWMEITEQGFLNINLICERIRELFVQGASDSYSYEDRKKIVTDIKSLVEQIGIEMNISYSGRYVFSGFRTDKSPILQQDINEAYNIFQQFNISDVQKTKSYQRIDNQTEPIIQDANIVKIAYNDIQNLTVQGFIVNNTDLADDLAYAPSTNGVVNFIKETGELIFTDDDVNSMDLNYISINYDKTNFKKTELNPEVYFSCTNLVTGKNYNMQDHDIQYEIGVNTKVDINSLAKDVYTDKMYQDLQHFINIVNTVEISDISMLQEKYKNPPYNLNSQDLQDAINQQIMLEKQMLQGVLQDRFSDMLQFHDIHVSDIAKEYADLGTKMSRIELVQNRLQEDEITYTNLLSQNEDTDYTQTIMNLKSAESVYQASLQIGANIIQTTLANFIR